MLAPSGAGVAVKCSKQKSGTQRFEYTPFEVGKRASQKKQRSVIFICSYLAFCTVALENNLFTILFMANLFRIIDSCCIGYQYDIAASLNGRHNSQYFAIVREN